MTAWYSNIENPMDTAGELLKLINKCSKVVRYKISTQNSLTLLFTLTVNYPQKKNQENNPNWDYSSFKKKYLGINLTQKLKDLCTKNHKSLKKLEKIQINGKVSVFMYRKT